MSRVFGPVPSRRLGRSLGVDVIPYKTCSFDCVYCECGKTTDKRCLREEFYPLVDIMAELDEHLGRMNEKPDVITLSGAGEPTLYSRTGELLKEIRKLVRVPVAVITNSSLMGDEEVRDELMAADSVLPSLDSAIEDTFQRINRPHPDCRLESIMDGLRRFIEEFKGKVFFEILFIEGMNTDGENLAALGAFLEGLDVESIQINTAVRPGTEKTALPLGVERLEEIKRFLGPKSEIIAAPRIHAGKCETGAEKKIITLLKRRPCTAEDISGSLGIPVPGVVKIAYGLLEKGLIIEEEHGETTFYTAVSREDE